MWTICFCRLSARSAKKNFGGGGKGMLSGKKPVREWETGIGHCLPGKSCMGATEMKAHEYP